MAGSGVVEKSSVKFEESFTFTLRATDNVGIASVGGIVYRPDQWPVAQLTGGVLISGNSRDGTYRVAISIPKTVNKGGIENNPLGTYEVWAHVTDTSGNAMRMSDGNYYIYIGTVSVTG